MTKALPLVFAMALALLPGLAIASAGALCDRAALTASERHDVPLHVLLAITRVETGRSGPDGLTPWPWTMNIAGKGFWLDGRTEAQRLATRTVFSGQSSFDVGCFQINYRWHGQHFRSLDHMFDPAANADYAARFLSELYSEFGAWPKAVAAYHSRSPEFSQKYLRRFNQVAARLDAGTIGEQISALADRHDSTGASLASVSGKSAPVPMNSLWGSN